MEEIMTYETDLPEVRDIDTITAEINILKENAGITIIEIGRRLIEAKEQLSHGEWLPWLRDEVQFSEDTAQRFMRIAKEYGNSLSNTAPVRYLGVSKALQILALPDFQREDFISEKHEVDGEEKSVFEMTKKELDQAIKEKLELQNQVDEYSERADELEEQVDKLEVQLRAAQEDLKAAKEVTAIEVVPDKEAEEKLRAEIKELKDKQKETKSKLEELKKRAETAESATKKALSEKEDAANEAAKKASETAERMYQKKIEDLEKQLKESGDSAVAVFKVHFNAIQQEAAEMQKCITELRVSGKAEEADKLTNAYKAVIGSLQNAI